MSPQKALPPEILPELARLVAAGISSRAIAADLGVSRESVLNYCKALAIRCHARSGRPTAQARPRTSWHGAPRDCRECALAPACKRRVRRKPSRHVYCEEDL